MHDIEPNLPAAAAAAYKQGVSREDSLAELRSSFQLQVDTGEIPEMTLDGAPRTPPELDRNDSLAQLESSFHRQVRPGFPIRRKALRNQQPVLHGCGRCCTLRWVPLLFAYMLYVVEVQKGFGQILSGVIYINNPLVTLEGGKVMIAAVANA